MHFFNCQNPQHIVVNGEDTIVPCGKCDYCRMVRSASIAERFRLESQHHKYCVFVTLTYADVFLPAILYDELLGGLYVPDHDRLSHQLVGNFDEGLFFKWPVLDQRSRSVIDGLVSQFGFVPRLSRYDLQCFFKRLRINIKRKICNKLNISYDKAKISYLACGEVGPTTFRPHYHFVLLFDEVEIYRQFKMLLSASWPYGSTSFRLAKGSREIDYITRYCLGVNRLPSVFKAKILCPFQLVSKACPVGMSAIDEEKIVDVLARRSPTILLQDAGKGSVRSVPLWRFLENRLFPRFTAYNYVPDWCRTRLLGCAVASESYHGFIESVEEYLIQRYNTIVMDYFQLHYRVPTASRLDLVKRVVDSATYSIWLAASRIKRNIAKYGSRIGVHCVADYVSLIDEYLHNKAMYQLCMQLEFENTFMRSHPEQFRYIDLREHDSGVYSVDDSVRVIRYLSNTIEYSHKTKAKKEYLRKNPQYMLLHEYDEFLEGF